MTSWPRRLARRLAIFASAVAVLCAVLAGVTAVQRAQLRNDLLIAGNDFTITSTISSSNTSQTADLLYPGTARYLWYTVHNPLTDPITVSTLSTALDPGFTAPPACSASNLDLSQSTFTGSLIVPATGTASVAVPIKLTAAASNQDGCRNVTFHFRYSGTATYTHLYATSVVLASVPNPSNLNQVVTVTATVSPIGTPPAGPTGTVNFVTCPTPACASTASLGSASVQPNGTAAITTSTLPAGPTYVRATFVPADPTNFSGSTSSVVTHNVNYTSCVTGTQGGGLTVNSGQWICIAPSGRVNGDVTVRSGGTLSVLGGTVNGNLIVQSGGRLIVEGGSITAINSTGATSVRVCGAAVKGDVAITGSTGSVTVGDGGYNGAPACGANTIQGSFNVAGNAAGFEIAGNAITKSLTVTGNTGGPHKIEANQIKANLACSGNVPAPTNAGHPNTVKGTRSGQCTGSF